MRSTLEVAKDLLGKIIVHRVSSRQIMGRILETEAYIGEKDKACHARFGRTKRNEPMYKSGGRTYIYLCYGLFNLLNLVTEKEGFPAAVLIRRIDPLACRGRTPARVKPLQFKSYGPGNLTKYLQIDRSMSDRELNGELYLADDGYKVKKISRKARVGIQYAGKHAERKWRFVLED